MPCKAKPPRFYHAACTQSPLRSVSKTLSCSRVVLFVRRCSSPLGGARFRRCSGRVCFLGVLPGLLRARVWAGRWGVVHGSPQGSPAHLRGKKNRSWARSGVGRSVGCRAWVPKRGSPAHLRGSCGHRLHVGFTLRRCRRCRSQWGVSGRFLPSLLAHLINSRWACEVESQELA